MLPPCWASPAARSSGSSTANTSNASSADIGPEENGALGVNAYLWRASLDTLAFMPLASADPYGGVIITDWYSNPSKKDERLKATVYILDTRLRADGVSAAVFRETLINRRHGRPPRSRLKPTSRWKTPSSRRPASFDLTASSRRGAALAFSAGMCELRRSDEMTSE